MAMYAQVGKDWVARAAELGLSKEDVSGWRQPYNELAIFEDRARKNPNDFFAKKMVEFWQEWTSKHGPNMNMGTSGLEFSAPERRMPMPPAWS